MRSAHLLKGAAANLMCGPLRQAAMQLEEAARAAHGATGATNNAVVSPEQKAAVQAAYTGLQQAAQAFVAFLQSIGV
jgi:HPt (histidine-containing phosphotransfer) domain-containing protein